MVDQDKPRVEVEIGKKLKNILDEVLSTGDWESSLFLKNAAAKLRDLRDKTEKLFDTGGVKTSVIDQSLAVRKPVPAGYCQVFIVLYQVDSANLETWFRAIKTLSEYSVTRPAYKDEAYAQEFIRAKTSGFERHGYVIVNVKQNAFYETEQQMDSFGHLLLALKEEAVSLDNIVEFVHANKRRYVVRDNRLLFVGTI